MEIRIEKHLEDQLEDNARGFFAGGVANSAIAGKCGNGGGIAPTHVPEGTAASLASRDELLEADTSN